MNAVAFCLYGNKPKYLEGMIQNAWLMPRIYPGWECHVWIDENYPIINQLVRLGCVIHGMHFEWPQRMFYRFLIHDEPQVERYLIRDADSRISLRERRCVDQWISSGKLLHTIHDHKYHILPIQGGMFGVWRAQTQIGMTMHERIGDWPKVDTWGQDQNFLNAVLWPMLSHSVCEHGLFNPIPSGDDDDAQAFVGEVYDQHGRPAHPEHRTMGNR